MYYIQFAIKNIFRKKQRSFVTIFTICLGFCALGVLSGMLNNIYSRLKEQAIINEKLGHITFVKAGYFQYGKVNFNEYLWNQEELEKIIEIIKSNDEVILTSPRLSLFGTLNKSDISSIYISEGILPEDNKILSQTNIDGRVNQNIQNIDFSNVAIGSELAKNLDIKVGESLTLLGIAYDGTPNAIDVVVNSIYNTGNPATNDKFLLINLEIVQELYGKKSAEKIIVTVKNSKRIKAIQQELNYSLENAGYNIDSKSWDEISVSYLKVRKMFSVIFRVLIVIISIIILLMMLNTFYMNITERTLEIASMRAMGLTRGRISYLFCLEGLIMSILGSVIAIAMLLLIKFILKTVNITFVPPVASVEVPVEIILIPTNLTCLFMVFISLGVISSLLSVTDVLQKSIAETLKYKI
ncbi:MAG: ABC transporter permease [Bacteroidales bacterium]|jgi:putative ABC transport system permease protein|nr:ABC transporter permease [Bacteroidales bacterium]